MAQPEAPTAWRIDRFAQDGALTILAARGGAGKSWLGMAACSAVESGVPLARHPRHQGAAVYVDGEMGGRQMADRFKAAGPRADAFRALDALGLNLAEPGGRGARRTSSDLWAPVRRARLPAQARSDHAGRTRATTWGTC